MAEQGLGNILSRDEFVEIMGRIVSAHDVSRDMSRTIKETAKQTGGDMLVNFFDPFVLYSGQLDGLVRTLEVMFRDEENQWISWWLFECDYGHNQDLLTTAYGPDGKNIPMGTLGDLYDRLVIELSLIHI